MKAIMKFDLREKLDAIDDEVGRTVHDGYKKSRLRVLIGLWEKGQIIDGEFRGVNSPPSYRELERRSGRDHKSLNVWHDLYRKYSDRQRYITEVAEPKAEEWTKKALGQKWTALLESGSPDWWTPKKYIEAVKRVMGGIDLDPASCAEANKVVRAKKYFSLEDNSLLQKWEGRIFLNPPYGEATKEFVEKFFNDFESSFEEGIVLVNSRSTDADWFQPLFEGIVCFTDHRIDFDSAGEKMTSSTHGSCFIYFGPNAEKFAAVFSQFGAIVKKWPDDDQK